MSHTGGYREGTKSLRDAVRRLDKDLGAALDRVWELAEEQVHAPIENRCGQGAGRKHSLAVEENLSSLVPDHWKQKNPTGLPECPWPGAKQTALNLFCLSAAACLHDLDKGLEKSAGEHGEASAREIWNHPDRYGLPPDVARPVGEIARIHGTRQLAGVPDTVAVGAGKGVRLPLAAALFIQADTLHTWAGREGQEEPGPECRDPKAILRWLVSGWVFDDADMQAIVFDAQPKGDDQVAILEEGLALMQDELRHAAPVLAGYWLRSKLLLRAERLRAIAAAKTTGPRVIGHQPYAEEHAGIFRGRDEDIRAVVEQVIRHHLSLLRGTSGMGKSSLLQAGVFPALKRLVFTPIYARPLRDAPVDSMIEAIWSGAGLPKHDRPRADFLRALDLLSTKGQGQGFVIALDQFEDLARFAPDLLLDFVEPLVRLTAGRLPNVHVLLVYRSESQGELDPLFERLKTGPAGLPEYALGPLDTAGAKVALDAGLGAWQ